MWPFASKEKAEKLAGGEKLLAVLPHSSKPWWLTRHLLILNIFCIVPFLSPTSVGFDGSMMNGLQAVVQWNTYFNKPAGGILGTINAMYPVGKFFGVYASAYLGDRFGRKIPLYTGLTILLIGAVIQAAAQKLAMFIVGRLIIGFGTSFLMQTSPILISELAYPTHRGRMTSLYYANYYVGAIIAAWVTYGTFRIPSEWSWRIPSALQGAIPFIQLSLVWFIPESPRWLIAHGRSEEARRFFVKYHAAGDENSPLVEFEMTEISEKIEMEQKISSESSLFDLFRGAANRRRTLITGIIGFYGSWTGNAVISYYLVLILETIGIKDTPTKALINGCLQIFILVCAVFAGTFVDRIGRRPLWLTSASGMLISFIIWTILNSRFAVTHDPEIGKAVLALVFSFSLFFAIGFAPMIFAYPIEIWSFTLRGRAIAFSQSITMLGLILGQFVNPLALKAIGWKYYIVFCCLLTIFVTLVYFFFPETKGRTLEEVAEIFEGKRTEVESVSDVMEVGDDSDEKHRAFMHTKQV